MRSLLQVVSALSVLIVSKAQPVVGSGLSCLMSSPGAQDGHTRVTFLREDAAGVRALFLTLWSEDARPVSCEVSADPLVTETYRRLCDGSHEVARRFNVSALLAPDARLCARVASAVPKLPRRTRRDETAAGTRRKRALMFPGTLWCGTGSKAHGYEQLGMFESADRCCREHDHCLHIIPSFTVNYGVFNPHFFTVSHCHCDQRFRRCLLGVNDTISSIVGYSFFNILRVPCFKLRELRRCTEMYWWGTCKVTKKAPYAVFKRPLRYSTSNVTGKLGDTERTTLIHPHQTSPKRQHSCSRDSPRGDTSVLRRTRKKGCKRNRKPNPAAPTTPSGNLSLFNASQSSALMPNNKRVGKKKSTRNGLPANPKHRSQVDPPAPRNPHPQAPVTQKPALHLDSKDAITAATKTGKKGKKSPKPRHCCGVTIPLRGDTFQPRCFSCLPIKQRNTTTAGTLGLNQTTGTAGTLGLDQTTRTAGSLGLNQTTRTAGTLGLNDTQNNPGRWASTTTTEHRDSKGNHTTKTAGTLGLNAYTGTTGTLGLDQTTKTAGTSGLNHTPEPVSGLNTDNLSQAVLWAQPEHNSRDSGAHQTTNRTLGFTTTQEQPALWGFATATIRTSGLWFTSGNLSTTLTDSRLLCGSLKHLDECKHRIHPLEKKFDLQNLESETAFHCDCTSR
ncbi:uncharacterized protein LOC116686801 [Etheostoma spectabile]|uniref:uncharacterized protein LOC116686801 n=1 Tax=Etheostoma spectabile TaxID=54343 RepID=UPI0013AF6ED9|nr:uncharacterized protein LOC116686801 [Etheostoma spectabile]